MGDAHYIIEYPAKLFADWGTKKGRFLYHGVDGGVCGWGGLGWMLVVGGGNEFGAELTKVHFGSVSEAEFCSTKDIFKRRGATFGYPTNISGIRGDGTRC